MPAPSAPSAGPRRVLVLGVPRSGTTWIGEALGVCDGAVYVHEPDGVHDPFSFRARSSLDPGAVLDPDRALPDYERLWAGAFAGGRKAGTLRDHLARRLYRGVTTAQRAAVRVGKPPTARLRAACALSVPRVAEPSRSAVVVKSVDAALTCEWIVARFDPSVLVIERDLRSVLASWVSVGMAGLQQPNYERLTAMASAQWGVELPPYGASGIVRNAVVCSVWAHALRMSTRRRGWTRVQYERVAASPATELPAIAETVGLEWGTAAADFVARSNQVGTGYSTQRVVGSTIDTWKERLDSDQIAAIETVIDCFPESLLG